MKERSEPKIPAVLTTEDAGTPEGAAQNSKPTESEENVLFGLHTEAARHVTGESKASVEKLNLLHDDVEHCECFPMFTQYIAGEIPTLERMFTGIQKHIDMAKVQLAAEGDDEDTRASIKMLNLLSGREQQIRSSVQRYVHSVIRFKQLQKLSLGGSRDLTRQFVDADHSRRVAHNNLLDSLLVYRKTLDTLVNDEILPREAAISWSLGEDVRTLDDKKAIIFSAAVIQNRDFVRDWAIVADFEQQFRALDDVEWFATVKGRST